MNKFLHNLWHTLIGYIIVGSSCLPFGIIYAAYSLYHGESYEALVILSILGVITGYLILRKTKYARQFGINSNGKK